MTQQAVSRAKELKKKFAKKNMSLPILIMESDFWDWNPTKRMLLLVIALGTCKEKERQ